MVGKERDNLPPREYKHRPLRDKRSIRILELLPGPSGSPLQCRVHERSLDSCGSYEALSYVWGEPDLVKTIQEDLFSIRITRNCSTALHHLRKSRDSRYLWVDSICIDQNSPLERNHQVGMMGTVYSKARRVIVWLGRSQAKPVNYAMTYIRHVSKQGLVPEKGHYESKVPVLNALFEKPWFSRAWPVQEVAFSRDCKMLCGHYSISADELMNFLTLVKDYTIVNWNLHRAHVHRQMWRYIQHVRFHSQQKLTNSTAMLLRTQRLDATDPKDKIFAVHGLLSQLGAHLPDPDYSKSIALVYQEAATVAIRHDNRLHILASVTGESLIEGLPSWVPDWSCNRPISEIASWDDYAVERANEPLFDISVDGKCLNLWGAEVDTIKQRYLAFPARYNSFDAADHGSSRGEIRVLQRWFEDFEEKPRPTSLVKFFSGLSEKPWTRMKSQFNLSTDVLSKYWIKGIRRIKKISFTHSAQSIDMDLRRQASDCAVKDGMKERHVRGDITPFHKLMRTLLDRKVMFITGGGHLGIASQAIRKDDRIVFFNGVYLPMVVRQVKSKWRLVAPAYIHNGMRNISKLQTWLVLDQVQKFDIV